MTICWKLKGEKSAISIMIRTVGGVILVIIKREAYNIVSHLSEKNLIYMKMIPYYQEHLKHRYYSFSEHPNFVGFTFRNFLRNI